MKENMEENNVEDIASLRKNMRRENSKKYRRRFKILGEIRNESIERMQKRHAFLSEIVKGYPDMETFVKEKSELFEMMGVECGKREKSVSLNFHLDFNEYEEYHVIPTQEGGLAVSNVVWWQNEVCANEILDIFTGETFSDDNVIFSMY